MMRLLVLATLGCLVQSSPLPDKPLGGFQPIHGARGTGPSAGYGAPPPAPAPGYSAPAAHGHGHGGPAGPTKTIYVNVPAPDAPAPLPPIAAGPPRKHYKIVFIRAPTAPPPPQPILPPRTEQKTIIYVLHQRPETAQQQVIEVPSIKHNPEVFFVQYDNPPTADELQKLSAGDLTGFSVSSQGSGLGDSLPLGSGPEEPLFLAPNDVSPFQDDLGADLNADVRDIFQQAGVDAANAGLPLPIGSGAPSGIGAAPGGASPVAQPLRPLPARPSFGEPLPALSGIGPAPVSAPAPAPVSAPGPSFNVGPSGAPLGGGVPLPSAGPGNNPGSGLQVIPSDFTRTLDSSVFNLSNETPGFDSLESLRI